MNHPLSLCERDNRGVYCLDLVICTVGGGMGPPEKTCFSDVGMLQCFIFSHAAGVAPRMAMLVGRLVHRFKYLNNYRTDCYEGLHGNSASPEDES